MKKIIIAILLISNSSFAQIVMVSTEVDNDFIKLDETIEYKFTINAQYDSFVWVNTSSDFHKVSTSKSSNTSNINGVSKYEYTITVNFKPLKTGILKTGYFKIYVKDKSYYSENKSIRTLDENSN